MIIKRFLDFVNESYLKGGRQPLYHYSRRPGIIGIINDDVLKMGSVARPRGSKAICLTRSPYFTHDGVAKASPRIVLNHDKLKNDGYNSLPVDEIGIAGNKSKHSGNFTKSKFDNIKSGKRPVPNGLDLPKPGWMGLEVEFEERIYSDIKDIGKYIISFEFAKESDIPKGDLINYLEKYPHIVINLYDSNKRNTVVDITDKIIEKDKVLLDS